MQRRYTGGARIFIYCCIFVCLLTAGAVVIQFTGMAEPSRSGRVFEVVRRPAVTFVAGMNGRWRHWRVMRWRRGWQA